MMNWRDHRLLSKANGYEFITPNVIGKHLLLSIICIDSNNRLL